MPAFHLKGLDPAPFIPLFGLSQEALAAQGVHRSTVTAQPGFPCRVSLADVPVGETVLLLNYQHQPGETPYKASHAIFVQEGAVPASLAPNTLPAVLRTRPLSIRSFTADHWMLDADLVDGAEAESLIHRLLDDERAAYLQVHFARRGCYAARVERA